MNKEDKMCLLAVVIIVVLMGSAFGYNAHLSSEAEKSDEQLRDNLGFGESYTSSVEKEFTADSMEIHYTARYSNGTVFATTLSSMATSVGMVRSAFFEGPKDKNNDGVPEDDPLSVQFGSSNDLPQALNDQLKGLREGESVSITLAPEDAYGEDAPELVRNIPLLEEIDVYQKLTVDEFLGQYPDEFLEVGVSFTHRFWGWKVTISDLDGDNVTLRNEPETPFTVTTLPWEVTADDIYTDRSVIRITHHPTEELVDTFVKLSTIKLYDLQAFSDIPDLKEELGQMDHSNTDARITSISNGIELDFNREMNGEWVTFDITVEDLKIIKV
jgi:FKBP-type peptidyl-prolyl cis-trans isomerase 2